MNRNLLIVCERKIDFCIFDWAKWVSAWWLKLQSFVRLSLYSLQIKDIISFSFLFTLFLNILDEFPSPQVLVMMHLMFMFGLSLWWLKNPSFYQIHFQSLFQQLWIWKFCHLNFKMIVRIDSIRIPGLYYTYWSLSNP